MKKTSLIALTIVLLSSFVWLSCQKKELHLSPNSSEDEVKILPNSPSPGTCYYFSYPSPFGGCHEPSGPFCHAESGGMPGLDGGLGFHTLLPNGDLKIDIDISSLNPSHSNVWLTTQMLEVPVADEVPYTSVVEAYNNSNQNFSEIPHYFISEGSYPITVSNGTGQSIITLIVSTNNTIQVSLQI